MAHESPPLSPVVALGAALGALMLVGALVWGDPNAAPAAQGDSSYAALVAEVLPSGGIELPLIWGDTGRKLIAAGAIDEAKFRELYASRGGLSAEEERLLTGVSRENLRITPENASFLLNLLWAFGLANDNPILREGEMVDPRYGGAGNFASTGGWTLAEGSAMDHYSRHPIVTLSAEEQALVDRVSSGIYRPCCGNSAHFPDCNHGMAMLGLLELMAAQGASEEALWDAALAVNSYWFPETYLTIAFYERSRGNAWQDVLPHEVLGVHYSSASGFADISSKVTLPEEARRANGCSV